MTSEHDKKFDELWERDLHSLFIEETQQEFPPLTKANPSMSAISSVSKGQVPPESITVPDYPGLDRFMAMVKSNPNRAPDKPLSWWKRFNYRLTDWGLSPALAMLVIVAQFGVFYGLVRQSSGPQNTAPGVAYRGFSAPEGTLGQLNADLKITVHPDAKFADVLELLRRNNCAIVAGPSAQGEIWVQVSNPTQLAEVQAAIHNSPLVDDISRTPRSEQH